MSLQPRIKLDRREVKAGEIIEVRTLVNHVMESGHRRAPDGKLVPRRIINRFTCTLNGKPVFSCDIQPAVSANPFIQFKLKAIESGKLEMTWYDDDGTRTVAVEEIKVA